MLLFHHMYLYTHLASKQMSHLFCQTKKKKKKTFARYFFLSVQFSLIKDTTGSTSLGLNQEKNQQTPYVTRSSWTSSTYSYNYTQLF